MLHKCDVREVQSKCQICEDIACGPDGDINQTCHFQLQGVPWKDMSVNIHRVRSHRYDFGGASATHVCIYLVGTLNIFDADEYVFHVHLCVYSQCISQPTSDN